VPAVIRWPQAIPAGSVSDQVLGNWDFYPTVYEILGLPIPENNGPLPFRGLSLLPLLKSGGQHDLGPVSYVMEIGANRSVQLGHWKSVRVGKAIGNSDKAEQPTKGTLLFDLSNDPGEQHDVSEQYPEILQRLEALAKNPVPRWSEGHSSETN
jgi:arylsulfatase